MTRQQLATAAEWAAREGWNPGKHDVETFHKSDPEGFYLSLDGDVPIASISAVKWNPTFAFIGLYIVIPERRGQGRGIELWRHAMQQVDGCLVGLDGVVAQQSNYARSGFRLAHRSLRFGAPAGVWQGKSSATPARPEQRLRLHQLDRRTSPSARNHMLDTWLDQPEAITQVLLQDGDVVGFAMARPCRDGFKLGPVVAPDALSAEQLIIACAAQISPQVILYWDLPETNSEAVRLAESRGLTMQFEVARMYTGPAPEFDHRHWFGVMSYEMG